MTIFSLLLFLWCCLVYVEIKKETRKRKELEREVMRLKGDNIRLQLRLVPIDVKQLYDGLPRSEQYAVWLSKLHAEFPNSENYTKDHLEEIFQYYLDFHGVR